MNFFKKFFIYLILLSIFITLSYQIKKHNAYASSAICLKCSELLDSAVSTKKDHQKLLAVIQKNEALLKKTPDRKSTLKIKINSNIVIGNIRLETLKTHMEIFKKTWKKNNCKKCKNINQNSIEDENV